MFGIKIVNRTSQSLKISCWTFTKINITVNAIGYNKAFIWAIVKSFPRSTRTLNSLFLERLGLLITKKKKPYALLNQIGKGIKTQNNTCLWFNLFIRFNLT